MSVIKKAINLANLKKEAQEKIKQYLSNSASTLRKEIGLTMFAKYNTLPDDEFVYGETGYVGYENLTDDQKLRRDLETAQAYFVLYFAVPGLKEFEMGSVIVDRQSFGDGDINPSTTSSLERLQKMYWKMATDICVQYQDSGDIGIMVI